MGKVSTTLVKLAVGVFSAVVGAMLTTNYSVMRANGISYLPALKAGLATLALAAWTFATSPWFLALTGMLIVIVVTNRVTVMAGKPRTEPRVALGYRMDDLLDDIRWTRRFQQFDAAAGQTIQLGHEIQAFMVDLMGAGIPVPWPQTNSAEQWIYLSRHYFETVGPYLRGGKIDIAISQAGRIAASHPPV